MRQLKVFQQLTIIALAQQGWSKRKIARKLGVDRSAVRGAIGRRPLQNHPPRKPARNQRSVQPHLLTYPT